MAPSAPAGWYPDPSGAPGQRYWDGSDWTAIPPPPPIRSVQEKTNKLGLTALILAVLGFVFAFSGGILGWACLLAAFILGIIGFTTSRGVGASTAAIIISVIGVVVRMVVSVATGHLI
ncbi:MAG: hypothetical protein QG597_4493 [Actinomycetota bacterium]|nr:hypothetical protein [Actinomycetota bacterium]